MFTQIPHTNKKITINGDFEHLRYNLWTTFVNSDHSEYLLRGSRYGQRTFRGWGETTTTLHKEDVHGEIKRNTIISLQLV